ncbi:hypothetical protein GC207_12830 [bacterium]|nr:hypothetical protein [bacterium]
MNNSFNIPLVAAVLTTLAITAEIPSPKLARTQVDPAQLALEYPMGYLGYPVGTYVQIEGFRQENGKVGTRTLKVDTISGEKLEKTISIWIENVKHPGLPSGKRCVFRGYESARMIGLPYGVAKAENSPLPQAVWQLQRYFIVTTILEPTDLEKK